MEVQEEDLQGRAFFVFAQLAGKLYVTDDLKEFIMRQQFTNLATQHVGPIVPTGAGSRWWMKSVAETSVSKGKAATQKRGAKAKPLKRATHLLGTGARLPRLHPDRPDSCPASIQQILEYLWLESPDGDELVADDLEFLRTARVGQDHYWVWRFTESDGTLCYVTVSQGSEDGHMIDYDEASGRTAEEFMLWMNEREKG
jgi:hypothetical protein